MNSIGSLHKLKVLNLSKNDLSSYECLAQILHYLKITESLQSLDISNCNISGDQSRYLVDVMFSNANLHLLELHLNHNVLGNEFLEKLS